MAKASSPGRTKTRLVPPLSFEAAAACNTAFISDIAANLLDAARAASLMPYIAYGPPGSAAFFSDLLPRTIGLIECWLPDFGDCLMAALGALFERGHASACVVNSDSPTLPTACLIEAAEVLARPGDRAVLGPSTDGGYYLLGLKRMHRRLFEDITWSTDVVAEQTLARAAEIGLDVHVLPIWYDVDDAASIKRLLRDVFGPAPGAWFAAPATRALLEAMRSDGRLAAIERGGALASDRALATSA